MSLDVDIGIRLGDARARARIRRALSRYVENLRVLGTVRDMNRLRAWAGFAAKAIDAATRAPRRGKGKR